MGFPVKPQCLKLTPLEERLRVNLPNHYVTCGTR